MKVRWISLGVAIGLALALTVGFAFGSGRSTPAAADRGGSAAVTQTDGWAAMKAMHDSPAMQRLHAQMPEELRAQCEAMHEQMEQMMGAGSGNPGGMMGPGSGGMMGS